MKRITINVLILLLVVSYIYSQEICKIGMQYKISTDPNWAEGYPVVTNVLYNSSAYISGVKVGDIITGINGIETKNLDNEQINQLLHSKSNDKLLDIQNIGYKKQLLLIKECHRVDVISEEQLTQAFALYSLRDAYDIMITYPITTNVGNENFSFENVKTYSFIQSNKGDSVQDSLIYNKISNILDRKGLRVDNVYPDVKIDIFYEIKPNQEYIANSGVKGYSYRYNFATQSIDKVPIMDIGTPINMAKYTISFGLSIIDNISYKHNIVWSSHIYDLLSNTIPITYYANNVLPLMLRSFPFVVQQVYPKYVFSKRHYNYTGIRYKTGTLNYVAVVDNNSIAYKCGIRSGDIVRKINGIPINNTNSDSIKDSYIKFLKGTNEYRNPFYSFDSNGLKDCRYWDNNKFVDISKVFVTDKYDTPFSYLFFFRRYINPTDNRNLIFEIERNGQIYTVILPPEELNYVNIIIQ